MDPCPSKPQVLRLEGQSLSKGTPGPGFNICLVLILKSPRADSSQQLTGEALWPVVVAGVGWGAVKQN